MVKIKFGANIANMSGKIGGQVYSHNAAGAYLRNIGTIAVSPSAGILASRARFATVIAAWKALTPEQRTAWYAGAINSLKTNVFADQYTQSGYQFFITTNNIRLQIGEAILNFPPFPAQPGQIDSLAISQPGGAASLSLDANAASVPPLTKWIVDATPPISPTKNNYQTALAQIAVLNPAEALPYDLYAGYVALYGAPVAAMRGGFRVTPVNVPSGTKGQGSYFNLIFA